jgi:CRP-like cAMP-binding protein
MIQNAWHRLLLARAPFSDLTDCEKAELLRVAKPRHLPRGQALFQKGDPADAFYAVMSGAVRLYRSRQSGEEKTLDIPIAGETIGEREIFDGSGLHPCAAEAVEDTTLIEFPAAWLTERIKANPQFALRLLARMSSHDAMAALEAEHQAQGSAVMLVACFLQRLCLAYQYDPAGFDLPYSKSLIASRLGMKLETFSRACATLKSHGILVDGRHVRIESHPRLESHICADCSVADSCPTRAAFLAKK